MSHTALAWIALNLIPGIHPNTIHRWVEACGSPEAVWRSSAIGKKPWPTFDWQDAAGRELQACGRYGCRLITLADDDYPRLLKTVAYPPPVLYVRGTLLPEDRNAVAVVGTRHPSSYGVSVTRELTPGLIQAGLTVVSGLARGIDTAAHMAALEAGGRTLAVVAHGLDQPVYPRENRGLHDAVQDAGAVISEFPFGTRPWPGNFPRRNRIISGLALGVLVVEAGQRSGALITARWAADQNREVFAVPGAYQASQSQGAHSLIQQGAKLVTGVGDILDELQMEPRPLLVLAPSEDKELTPEQICIVQHLEKERSHVDQLAETCGLAMPQLLNALLHLELMGRVQSMPGQHYRLSACRGGRA